MKQSQLTHKGFNPMIPISIARFQPSELITVELDSTLLRLVAIHRTFLNSVVLRYRGIAHLPSLLMISSLKNLNVV